MKNSRTFILFALNVFVWILCLAIHAQYTFRFQNSQTHQQLLPIHEVWRPFVEMGFISSLLVSVLACLIYRTYARGLKRLLYEMDRIAEGDLDVEIYTQPNSDLQQLSWRLEKIRMSKRQDQQEFKNEVQLRTMELKTKIADLEKMRDVTTDSILMAKNLQQERDMLLSQVQQMKDNRKK